METILIAEDDPGIRQLLKLSLSGYNYALADFENGEDALEYLSSHRPDAAILDLMLPGKTGYDILSYIRSNRRLADVPVLILSAKDTEYDKILGLDMGADGYLTKPFSVLELAAHIRSMLRRSRKEVKVLSYKGLVLDPERRSIQIDGKNVDLTYKEFELLRYLMSNINRALEREELINKIWGYDFIGESRTLDVHINSLRRKLGKEYASRIQSVRQVGYKFQAEDPDA
jgi:two-component system alkaline phosphatase synthesis response regulator PhoP